MCEFLTEKIMRKRKVLNYMGFANLKKGFVLLLFAQTLSIGHSNNQAHYENLLKLAEKELENNNYVKSLEYLVEIKVYAKEHNILEMQAAALNRMGIIYTNMLYYEKAMECCLESYQITLDKASNITKISTLNNIGELHFLSNNIDKAAEYLDKAYKIAEELKDSSIMILSLNNLCVFSNKKGDLEQTEKYLNIAMEIMEKYPVDSFYTFLLQYIKTEYLYLKKEYDLAEQLALEALEHDFGEGRLSMESKVEYLLILSKIYYQKKNYSKAVSYAKNALENNIKLPMGIEIYEHLSEVYRATNSLSLVIQCQDSIIRIKNSLTEFNNMNQILIGQIQFDLNNMEISMSDNKAKQKRNHLIFVFVIIFIIALFLLILFIRSVRGKQLKMVAELEKKEKLLLEQKVKEQKLEEKIYKKEIELKNKQLISNTLFQTSKNESIEEIIQILSNIPEQSEITNLQPVIKRLKDQIKEPAHTDWNSFLTYFEQTNPNFLATLKKKHPKLNIHDIRLSSYINLNLDTKEISKLLHITPEYCKKKKQRLAQKLGMPTTEIYRYLTKIK